MHSKRVSAYSKGHPRGKNRLLLLYRLKLSANLGVLVPALMVLPTGSGTLGFCYRKEQLQYTEDIFISSSDVVQELTWQPYF